MKEKKNLPAPTPGAADVATVGAGIAAAFAAVWFPVTSALGATAISFAISKYVKRPQRILLEQLRAGDLSRLSDEQVAEFIPMGYRFFEAAKQGEYEHTLKVLAAFIVGELGQELPDAGNFARTARRLEGISKDELRVVAWTASLFQEQRVAGVGVSIRLGDVSEGNDVIEEWRGLGFTLNQIAACFNELTNRGLIHSTWLSTYGGGDVRYSPTDGFWEIVDKAGTALPVKS